MVVRGQKKTSGTYFRGRKTDNIDDTQMDCAEMYPSIFGAEIHTLGRSAPESFPDTDPVMVCSRVTFPMPVGRIAAMCLQRHPCKEVKFWNDIYTYGPGSKVRGELTTALPISKTYLDTRREQCWSGEKVSSVSYWEMARTGPKPIRHGIESRCLFSAFHPPCKC